MTNTSFVARDGTVNDLNEVFSLVDEMYSSYGNSADRVGHNWKLAAREWIGQKLDESRICLAVAENENGIGACGVGIIYEDIPQFWLPNGRLGCVRWMSTSEELRGQGIGAKILDHILDWFQSRNIRRVNLHASEHAYDF